MSGFPMQFASSSSQALQENTHDARPARGEISPRGLLRAGWGVLGLLTLTLALGCCSVGSNCGVPYGQSPWGASRVPLSSTPTQTAPAQTATPPASVVRGQYTSGAGRSVPSLPASEPHLIPAPSSSSSSYSPAPASTPLPAPAPATAPTSRAYGDPWKPRPTLPSTEDIAIPGGIPSSAIEDPAFMSPQVPPEYEPTRFIDLTARSRETQTGRLMFGVGVNSDAGLVGSVVIDEQNFDWRRFPRSWEDIRNATAWRGAGQRFRLEAVPGTEVQRYMFTFQEPYLLNTRVSLGLSGYYYNRYYTEWDEDRVGGRIAFGYQLAPDLSTTFAYRGAKIDLFNPIEPTPTILQDAVGTSALHGFKVSLTHDTRDNAFLATEGHLIELGFEQVIGTYQYPRADIDIRKFFLLRQRPDGSGRHVLKLAGSMSVTGSDTPIYEHYFAGGFSTIRGFDFRGASPHDLGVAVGGEFMVLASVEYMFPITADDALRGVIFCDTGTVEPTISDWNQTYRVAPGFGLRISIPAMGPAPIALDFAFPVSEEPGDEEEVFSFFVGFGR